MASQTLLHYLSTGLPRIPTSETQPGRNTTNARYGPDDITQILPWREFIYSSIIQRYGQVLMSKRIRPDPIHSPAPPVRNEPTFHLRFSSLVMDRVRRALRAGFEQLAPELESRQLSVVTIDGGGCAKLIDKYWPDVAFVIVGASISEGANRAPGDLKVSWKWRSSMRFAPEPTYQQEYKLVLAQLNFYMRQHKARYGFILTDMELVPVKRLDECGRLAIAESIPWTSGGAGTLSVLLGLWYIGMLAAEDNNWALNRTYDTDMQT